MDSLTIAPARGNAERVVHVGDGATEGVGSDCYPYTIVEIKSDRRVVVQRDNYKRTDKNGFSESQEYEYSPCPEAAKIVVTLRKNGRWVKVGQSSNYGGFYLGNRRAYQDPCF